MPLGLIAAILLLRPSSAPNPTEWSQFRGNDGQGHATEGALPLAWSESENIRWKTPIPGSGWSSPVVRHKQVWVTTSLDGGRSLRAVCVHRETGRVLHDVEVFAIAHPGRIHQKNSHASPTPVIADDRLYVHFGAHGTACVSTSGEVLWRTRALRYAHDSGPGGSPVLYQGLLFINCDGKDVQFVAALDKETGRVVWKTPRRHTNPARRMGKTFGAMAYSTPLVIDVAGSAQLISAGADHVAAYEPRTGKEIWWAGFDGFSVVPRPVYGGGLVFVCSGYGKRTTLYAIRPTGRGNVTHTHVAWTHERAIPTSPSPLLVGDLLFLVNDLGIASCLDSVTGELRWRRRLGGTFSASPVYADGRVYLQNEHGGAVVLAARDEFRELGRNYLDGETLASYAVAGGALFLRSDEYLYCIEQQ